MRLFTVQRALGVGLAVAACIHVANAKEINLNCIILSNNSSQQITRQLTIDLDNRWLAFDKKSNDRANEWYDIIKVSKFAITAILSAPNIDSGSALLVLNRDA
jgi:hypothetical protein